MAKKKQSKINRKKRWLLIVGVIATAIILFLVYSVYLYNSTTFQGMDFSAPPRSYSLDIPKGCTKGLQSSSSVMPGQGNITCKDFVIVPNVGGHGLGGPGVEITKKESDITLGEYKWKRTIFSAKDISDNAPPRKGKIVTYITEGKTSFMIKVQYEDYSAENQALVESIISTFKFTQ